MRRTFRSGLRVQFLAVMLITLVPVGGLMLYSAFDAQKEDVAEARANALRTVQLTSGRMDELISGAEQLLIGLSRVPDVREANLTACNAFFADLLLQYPQYANLGTISSDASLRCSGFPLNGTVSAASLRSYRRTVTTLSFSVGEYGHDGATGRDAFDFGYPLLSPTGTLSGVIFAALDLGWLSEYFSDSPVPAGAVLGILDGSGTVISHRPDASEWTGRAAAGHPFVEVVRTRAEGVTEIPGLDGVNRIYAFTFLRAEGAGHVFLGVSKEGAAARAQDRLLLNLAGLGLVAVVGLTAAFVFSETTVVSKVKRLLRSTQRLRSGDLSARTGLEASAGELGELGHAFDRMAESLEDQRQKLELALERVQELDRLKTQFINTAAHELSTPLTPIRLQLYNLKQLRGREITPEAYMKSLQVIERNFERLVLLVKDVLDVARLQSGRLPLRPGPVEVAAVFQEAMESFQERCRQAGIRLTSSVEPGLRVVADGTRVQQVLFNLIENAVKFSPDGGEISLEARRDGDWALVRVRDTGIGMTAEQIHRLFRPFSQVHDTMQKTRGGTGLGLFICKGIIEQHGGQIWCESPGPGRGATFSFSLAVDGSQPGRWLVQVAAAAEESAALGQANRPTLI